MAISKRGPAPRQRTAAVGDDEPRRRDRPPWADETEGYVDFFDNSGRRRAMPIILTDGTSVRFPQGWTEKDAKRWREASGYERPLSGQK